MEEATCATAVEDAVIEAEGEVGFGGGGELGAIPVGDDATCAHSEDQGLFGEWDGSCPLEAEGAEVGDGGD